MVPQTMTREMHSSARRSLHELCTFDLELRQFMLSSTIARMTTLLLDARGGYLVSGDASEVLSINKMCPD
jgi:hypothetical protein